MNWAKIITLALFSTVSLWAQETPAPQTARQALIEMFFGKSPKSLERHLPPTLLAELRKGGAATVGMVLEKFSSLPREIAAGGDKIETFEAGPNIVVGENPEQHQRVEIVVERDDLSGDMDEIEVSVQVYKDGQPVPLPVLPRITFEMKQEKDVWRLNQITLAAQVPLADPGYVKNFAKELRRNAGLDTDTPYGAMRTILLAEEAYKAAYPQRGYACSLADLDGAGSGSADEHHAQLLDQEIAHGKKNGYTYAIADCSATPATRFLVTARPDELGSAFCADQTGVIQASRDGDPANCGKKP